MDELNELETPCFILDKEKLNYNIDGMTYALKKYWNNYIIGYSYKTNSLPWLINYMKNKKVFAEVVSDLEYKLALKIGYSEKNIIFNGPNKGKKLFFNALKNGSIVNIDSWREIKWLKEFKVDKNIEVGIRVNFDLEKECPGETSMGKECGRFGFSLENGDLIKAINEINLIENIKVCGIHMHNSTKTRSLNIYRVLAKKACEISKKYQYNFDYIDIGGGFFGGLENKPSYLEYIRTISVELSKYFDSKKTKLIIEPGASIIASPIDFLCKVIDIKNIRENRIVVVNGSRNNIDPLMRKSNYFYEVITENKNKINKQVISGYTCMEDDRIIDLKDNYELKYGDKILFKKVGSYTICLSPLFIEYFPKVYLLENKCFRCIREKWGINEYIQKSLIE